MQPLLSYLFHAQSKHLFGISEINLGNCLTKKSLGKTNGALVGIPLGTYDGSYIG